MKTVIEIVNENNTLNNNQIVSEMLFSQEQAETSSLTVWEKAAYIFIGHLCENMNDFRDFLTENMDETVMVNAPITEQGIIKFRSWDKTKVFWQYASCICKAIEVSGDPVETIFPANEPLPTLSAIKKIAYKKKESTAFKKCTQLLTTLNNLVTKVTNEQEKQELLALINETVAGLK